MAREKFDIKYKAQIEKGIYSVVTRNGLPVRIICWDCNNEDYPIVGLVRYEDGHEEVNKFDTYGNYDKIYYNDMDLFAEVCEPKFKEENNTFREILLQCCQEYNSKYAEGFTKYYIDEMLGKYEKKLRKIALEGHIKKLTEQVQDEINYLFGNNDE